MRINEKRKPQKRQGENKVRSRGARDRRALTGGAGNASRRKHSYLTEFMYVSDMMGEFKDFQYTCQMIKYNKGHHPLSRNHYHIVWMTKYPYRVLYEVQGHFWLLVRQIIEQVAEEQGIKIISEVLFADKIDLVVSIPSHIDVIYFLKVSMVSSSRNIKDSGIINKCDLIFSIP